MSRESSSRFFRFSLAIIFLVGLALRVGYVADQRASDPTFNRPILDGAYYLEWARGLTGDGKTPAGAFYLAPLYAYALAGFRALFGENFALLYILQHALSLGAAALLALVARRAAGDFAGLATAGLLTLYHPAMFFASTPLGETVAIFFLAVSLFLMTSSKASQRLKLLAGVFIGVAALARPNLIAVGLLWACWLVIARRWREAVTLVAGTLIAVLPITARNFVASGHPVLISSNMGVTLYHGNGPGASGIYTSIPGTAGDPEGQRDDATALASKRAGRPLDPVEADRWWAKQALETRLADLPGTAILLGYRALLLVDSHEHALDYSPSLDANAWRLTYRWPRFSEIPLVPFGLLVGLSVIGLVFSGWSGAGGACVWLAAAVSALTPILFYVSSRYRLPLAALLAVPAGVGCATLFRTKAGRRWATAIAAGVIGVVVSFLVPSSALVRLESAAVLANRAHAHRLAARNDEAERDARSAVTVAPEEAFTWNALGSALQARGRVADAETAFRESYSRDPTLAAGNLAALLISCGRPTEAIPILRGAVERGTSDRTVWANLVVALAASGDPSEALAVAEQASRSGIIINPRLLEAIRRQSGGG